MKETSYNRVANVVAEFQKRISAQSLGYLPPPTPTCPNTSDNESCYVEKFTVCPDELRRSVETEIVMHHGFVPMDLIPRMHFLYRASPIIFSNQERGSVDLSTDQVNSILGKRIVDWGAITGHLGPIDILCHNGAVQSAVFNAASLHCFRANVLRESVRGANTYRELAFMGGRNQHSIVFGLRPAYAIGSNLNPIRIAGMDPLNRYEDTYPNIPVWLSVPNHQSIVPLIQYLDLVARRIKQDCLAMENILQQRRQVERAVSKVGK